MNDFFVLKVSNGMIEVLYWVLDEFFTILSVNFIQFVMRPTFDIFDPIVCYQPQIAIRKKLLRHLMDFRVVCNLLLKQVFSWVVSFCICDWILKSFIDHDYFLSNLIVLIFFIVCMKLGDGSTQGLNVVFELLLLSS